MASAPATPLAPADLRRPRGRARKRLLNGWVFLLMAAVAVVMLYPFYFLLDNAFRFTPAGGTVTVGAHGENGTCSISVEDTGAGIPEEHFTRVFERFYRVDSSRSRSDEIGRAHV